MGECGHKKGGTAIPKPEEMADLNYRASTYECSHLIDSLKGRDSFDPICHSETMKDVRDKSRRLKAEMVDSALKNIRGGLVKNNIRRLE